MSAQPTAERDWHPDVARVAPRLWIGSAPAAGAQWSQQGGFDLIVLCAREDQPRGHNFPGVRVLHAGFDDVHFPTRNDYAVAQRAAELVSQELSTGRRVLVTCMQGRNRSGLVCALTLHLNGASGADALTGVRRVRPNALTNRKFAAFLRSLS